MVKAISAALVVVVVVVVVVAAMVIGIAEAVSRHHFIYRVMIYRPHRSIIPPKYITQSLLIPIKIMLGQTDRIARIMAIMKEIIVKITITLVAAVVLEECSDSSKENLVVIAIECVCV